ncbi:MAG TPA: TldD/PmbA family protein [Myxococcaceae bacterium]|nr:TldD/PmbA family protein [Myxococcaceae bacterium]
MLVLALALAVLSAAPEQTPLSIKHADPRVALLDAMSGELERNHRQLRLDGHEAPYFIAYQVKDYDQREISARFGALFTDAVWRDRQIYVDVRVGSYEFDNSMDQELEFNFSSKGTSYVTKKIAPLDDDPLALRNALWLITDEKYKAALFDYLKKRGENVYAVEDPKKPHSFSRTEPDAYVQKPLPFAFARERWTKLARKLSDTLNGHPEIFDGEVRVTGDKVVRYFTSSEGTRLVTEETLYGIHVTAVTRAADGQLLDNSRDYYAPLESQLPADEVLFSETGKMIQELLALRRAPAIDPYTGPAILAPEAAGVLFHEAVGHRLEGERQNDDKEGKTFRGQVGQPVLPSFLSVYDDPTLRELAGRQLNGYYLFDEEGVKAQKVTLIESGVLKNYLLSRRPVEGGARSNGHGRSQGNQKPMARMANLIVQSKRQVTDEELKRMLIAEARRQGKPYGLMIRDITGGNTNTSNWGYQAFKGIPRMVYRVDVRDGKETLVRGVEIVGTPLSSINKVMATGKTSGVFNGFCGAESGSVPVSAVAPATLLQEIELQRAVEGKDRPPLLESPATVLRRRAETAQGEAH